MKFLLYQVRQSRSASPHCCRPAVTSTAAEDAQNPIADLISVPFQNNTNFNVGPFNRAQNVLNI